MTELRVGTFDARCTDKEQAVKVLEEAAEAYGEWQFCRICSGDTAAKCARCAKPCSYLDGLADELADVITAVCNLAERYGLDMAAAMGRCERRNRDRGRIE